MLICWGQYLQFTMGKHYTGTHFNSQITFSQAEEKKNPKDADLFDRQRAAVCNAGKQALCCPMTEESGDPTALPLAGQCGFNPDAEFIFGGEDTKVGHIMSLYVHTSQCPS